MTIARARAIGTAQPKMRVISIMMDGTLANPVPLGFDQFGITNITKNAGSEYVIEFKYPFERPCAPLSFFPITANTRVEVVATAEDRITVKTTDLAGAATDAAFYLNVIGSDNRFDV